MILESHVLVFFKYDYSKYVTLNSDSKTSLAVKMAAVVKEKCYNLIYSCPP